MKKIMVFISLLLVCVGCDVAKNVAGTYSLTQCEYKYKSITGLTLAGVNVQNVDGLSSLNPMTAANLLAAFSKNSLPLQFTLNLNVKNPGYQTAILNGLQYILEVDNVQMTTGMIDSKMQIATGQVATLPVNLSFDLKKVFSGESSDAIKNMAFNFVGLGDKPSNVIIKLKPTLVVGDQTFVSPAYIPVSFVYGKGNKL